MLAKHLEAICLYISNKVEPRLASCISGPRSSTSIPQREQVLNSINKADFLDFFNSLKISRGASDPGWRDLLSPYEMTYEMTRKILEEAQPMLKANYKELVSRPTPP